MDRIGGSAAKPDQNRSEGYYKGINALWQVMAKVSPYLDAKPDF